MGKPLTCIDPTGNFPELIDLLLGCEHYATVNVANPVIDNPALPVFCPKCKEDMQLHVDLQHRMNVANESGWDDAAAHL